MTDEKAFAFEKKKYIDSVQNTLEKAIRFERLNPDLKADNLEQMKIELTRIGVKVAKDNHIPGSAFGEILSNADRVAELFTLLRFGYKKRELDQKAKEKQNKIMPSKPDNKEEPLRNKGFKR